MDIVDFCTTTFPFLGIEQAECAALLSQTNPRLCEYKKGDQIYPQTSGAPALGFVVRGECEVVRRRAQEDLSLNTLREGESFGILSLFQEGGAYPTAVYAAKKTLVLFFDPSDFEQLIRKSSAVSLNIIRFLADRAKFLNYKIAILSGITVEERLAKYLLMQAEIVGSCEFPINSARVASRINCGRASLYRAIDSLSERGYITFQDKKIIINSSSELERM